MRTLRLMAALMLIALACVTIAAPSSQARVPFSDGFESGNLGAWSSSTGLRVQNRFVYAGNQAARNARSKAWASEGLGGGQKSLYFRMWLMVRSNRDPFQIMRFETSSGQGILSLAVLPSDRLNLINNVRRGSLTSAARIHRGWNDIQMRIFVNGNRSRATVWLDRAVVRGLNFRRLGVRRVGRVELGNPTAGRRYDAVYDEVEISTRRIVDPAIAAAGNIACDPTQRSYNGGNGTAQACRMRHTSNLLTRGRYNAVLAIGDTQYKCGGPSAYNQSYDPTWGRVVGKTYPVPGDKEYRSSSSPGGGTGCIDPPHMAAGYDQYFRGQVPAMGTAGEFWYSFDIGDWHIIALNSACGSGVVQPECTVGSPQYQFLQNDLNNNTKECTLAFFHHPRFSSGVHGDDPQLGPFWNLLYQDRVELVLNAHEHTYERFRAQNPNGNRDRRGIVQFVLGQGGNSHAPFNAPKPNSVVRDKTTFGVLKLDLHAGSWNATFVRDPGSGSFRDKAAGACR